MTDAEQDFRRVRFKSPDLVDKPWLEWFRDEFSSRLYQAKVETKADAPFWLDSSIRILPDLVLFAGGASPMSWTKDAGEHSFGLTIAVAGQLHFETAGSGVLVDPGGAIVGRPTDRLETNGETRFLCVRLSPRLIAPLVPDYADIQLKELAADPQPLRLLISYLRMLDLEETIETEEARHLAALHVHDLAALADRYGAGGSRGIEGKNLHVWMHWMIESAHAY